MIKERSGILRHRSSQDPVDHLEDEQRTILGLPDPRLGCLQRHILNLKWLDRVEPGLGDNLVVSLRGGMTLEISRRPSARFREALSL